MLQRFTWETRQHANRRSDELRWVAQAGSQCLVLACPIYELLYHGTRGPGKTETMLIDFLKDVGRGLGAAWHGIVFRRTYPELSSIIKRSLVLFPQLVPGAKYNANEREWRFPGGEYLQFRFIERTGDGGDYDKYHGWEIPWICFEELCTWPTAELYLNMQSCCRSSDPRVGPIARIRATANPLGVGHSWVKKHFRLGGSNHTRLIEEGGLKRCAIFGYLEENKILLKSDPLYRQKLIASCKGSPHKIKAWLYGSWDVTAGGMFDDIWDPRFHVLEPIVSPPPGWRLDHGFDWGSSKPFSLGVWGQSDGSDFRDILGNWHASVRGDLYRIGEWYGCDPEESNVGLKLYSNQIAEGIVERELDMGFFDRMLPGPADPSIFTETDGKSIATVMSQIVRVRGSQYKGPTFTRADNSRITGWERVRTMLGNAKPGPEGMREHPGLFVTKNCAKFLELFPVTLRDPDKPDDVDTDTEDHLQDETRYRCKAAQLGPSASSGRVAGPAGDAERSRFAGQRNTGRVTWR
jgi:hypothetical protein